jgi:hypothetical protein
MKKLITVLNIGLILTLFGIFIEPIYIRFIIIILIKLEINHQIKQAEERATWNMFTTEEVSKLELESFEGGRKWERGRIEKEIENFNLWSKGTIEGTRADIIYKLKNKIYGDNKN